MKLAFLSTFVLSSAAPQDSLSLLQTSAFTKKEELSSTECKEATATWKESKKKAKADRAAVKAARKALKDLKEVAKQSNDLTESAETQYEIACGKEAEGALTYPFLVSGAQCPIIYLDEPGHLWDLAPSCDDGIFLSGEMQFDNVVDSIFIKDIPNTMEGFQQCIAEAKKHYKCTKKSMVSLNSCGHYGIGSPPTRPCWCHVPKSDEEFDALLKTPKGRLESVLSAVPAVKYPPHQIWRGQGGGGNTWASCTLMSRKQWESETKKALNAPVKTLATDCNEGYSRTTLDEQNDLNVARLERMYGATTWEECLAQARAHPKCSSAMAISWDEANPIDDKYRSCYCFNYYGGAKVNAGWRTCVIKDKFVADSPDFATWFSKTNFGGGKTARELEEYKNQRVIDLGYGPDG
jgi:hypothetical protein